MAGRSFRRIIARRLANVVLTIIGIMILNFCLIHFMPGDPVDSLVPRDPKFDVALKWKLYEDFHLNDSILEQLATYMWNAVTLEWGTSYIEKRSVEDIILTDLRWTMLLVGVSTVFTILIGMIVGAYAAYRRRGAFDIGSTALLLFFYGMPVFWFAMILQWSFTHKPLDMDWWPQLPAGGYYDVERFGSELHWSLPVLLSVLEYLIVPSMVLTISYIAGVSLVMRSSLIDTLTEDYVMTAKSKGLTEYQVLRNHALPNGMPPMIALIAMDVAFIIGGAYQVEYIFNYPGIGYRTIKAINELDFPLLQFIVVIGGVAVVLANFVADLMLIYIDPRIKIT